MVWSHIGLQNFLVPLPILITRYTKVPIFSEKMNGRQEKDNLGMFYFANQKEKFITSNRCSSKLYNYTPSLEIRKLFLALFIEDMCSPACLLPSPFSVQNK